MLFFDTFPEKYARFLQDYTVPLLQIHSFALVCYSLLHNHWFIYLYIYLSLHRVPKDVGSMNKISPSIHILSIPISLEEGTASNDIILSSPPWSPLSIGIRDHLHKNAFGKTHVAHPANMTKLGQLWFSDVSKDPLGFKFAAGNAQKDTPITHPIPQVMPRTPCSNAFQRPLSPPGHPFQWSRPQNPKEALDIDFYTVKVMETTMIYITKR